MAQPPAGSSLLFGALADSGRIKERKSGSYRMVLKGIDVIDWFTDRPDRVAGEWSPKKLLKEWDVLFSDGAPNAEATFEVGSKRELVTFEMFKPKLSDSNQTLSFKVRGIGEKNKDLLTGLKNKRLSDASLFIDDGETVVNVAFTTNGPVRIIAESGLWGESNGSEGNVDIEGSSLYINDEGEAIVEYLSISPYQFGTLLFAATDDCASTPIQVNYTVERGNSGEVNLCPPDQADATISWW